MSDSSAMRSRTCSPKPRASRSYISVVRPTAQPLLTSPSTWRSCTRTLSKKTSLNSASPVICLSGFTVTPGVLHVEQEVRDALVLGRVGIGAGQQHHPVGHVGERRPHLLAVDDVVVAVLHRPRLQRGQVGAGVGLRVALAPDLLAGEDLRRVALLLLLGAVRDDRRARPCRRRGRSGSAALSASAISSCRIISSTNVSPWPPYSLRPGDADEAAVEELAAATARTNSYASARGTSVAPSAFHSGGMLALSHERTRSRNACWSGVSVKSTGPS